MRLRLAVPGLLVVLAAGGASLALLSHQSKDGRPSSAPRESRPAIGSQGAFRPKTPVSRAHCFASPHSCGYPDPTNTGVPPGTTLTPSGSINVTTPGQTIDGRDVTGSITIGADDVTVENTRVTLRGRGCGRTATCGNYEVRIAPGVTGTVIRHTALRAARGTTCEHDIRNEGDSSLRIQAVYMHGCDSNLYGGGTMVDSYGVARLAISADHVENVYFDDTRFTAIHDTLLNPVGQTAVIFGDSHNGVDTTNCTNRLVVSNSLLAGGGYTIYPCAHSSRAGSSTMDIEGNHFARCTTADVFHPDGGTHTCKRGRDSHGYFPLSGDYGIAADFFRQAGPWRGNVWDDDLRPVCIDSSVHCG